MTLAISDKISLPVEAVTQTIACIGRKGAGKTYLATMLAEQMLAIHAQIVVLDPVGNWYGLRIAANGHGKGKDIFILGGEHGDMPLTPESGARIAQFVVSKRASVVLDISNFRQGERKRFAADFAEEFYHLKKTERSAVHLFVEEAQLFAPQRSGPDEARMLGAYENIIRLGRNYGIGATLITQRPQSVNKEVLSQVECLCVLQVNGTHERKALDEWVQEAGADRKLVNELPGLGRGEGYVWSPSWLRKFEKVKFAKKTTFDASATPEVGKLAKAALVSTVDIEALRESLQEVVVQSEKTDPKALQRRVRELERELQQAERARAAVEAQSQSQSQSQGLSESEREEIEALRETVSQLQQEADAMAAQLVTYKERIAHAVAMSENLHAVLSEPEMEAVARTIPAIALPKPRIQLREGLPSRRITTATVATIATAPAVRESVALRAGARRMLAVLCQWSPAGRTEAQVASQVGMKRTGGTFGAYKSDLVKGGYMVVRDGLWFATEVGLDFTGGDVLPAPATTAEVVNLWAGKLRKGAREMLDVLVARRGRPMDRTELGEAVGMEARGGTFGAYLTDLKQAGLIVVDRGTVAANRETLLLS